MISLFREVRAWTRMVHEDLFRMMVMAVACLLSVIIRVSGPVRLSDSRDNRVTVVSFDQTIVFPLRTMVFYFVA